MSESAINASRARGLKLAEEERATPKGPVAIVLAGAGARGAYEAGFIATLLPRLEPRPKIFVGTSAGAINAALLAANAHLPPREAANALMASWKKLHNARVFGPFWKSVPSALAQYALALAAGAEPPQSLAETAPLQAALRDPDLLDWKQVQQNLSSGALDVLGVVATETGSGRSKVFYQTKPGWNPSALSRRTKKSGARASLPALQSDETQAIDYVQTTLGADHVRASAAIPVLFPPVPIEVNQQQSYFIDGGVRLNAPLKPALQFGAEGLVVVSTDPRHYGTSLAVDAKSPTMQGQVLQLLRAVFADRMIEDIRVLQKCNRAARLSPDSEDREIPLIFGGPTDQDRLGGIAARAIDELLRGLPFLRYLKNIDVALLNFMTSVSATSGPDLLSYVLFEPKFISGALKAGIQDASALLNDYPEPEDLWRALDQRDQRHRGEAGGSPLASQPAA